MSLVNNDIQLDVPYGNGIKWNVSLASKEKALPKNGIYRMGSKVIAATEGSIRYPGYLKGSS